MRAINSAGLVASPLENETTPAPSLMLNFPIDLNEPVFTTDVVFVLLITLTLPDSIAPIEPLVELTPTAKLAPVTFSFRVPSLTALLKSLS